MYVVDMYKRVFFIYDLGGKAYQRWRFGDFQQTANIAQNVHDGSSCEGSALVYISYES